MGTAPVHQSMIDFYADPSLPYAGFPQEHRTGGSMPVELLRVQQEAFETTDPAIPGIVVCCALQADMSFRWNVGDGWTETRKHRGGEIALFPHMTDVDLDCGGDHELLIACFPSKPLLEVLDTHRVGTLSAFDPLTGATQFQDAMIRRTMMQLWSESARAGGASDLLSDGLTQVLIARLDRLIADRLAERITVETLASALDMPRWTFADAFKGTIGETPHAYVTARRVERACDLLRLGDLPLAEIAYATGFSSQSHMTDTFRRCLDTTPGEWRREVRK